MNSPDGADEVRAAVRARYGAIAAAVKSQVDQGLAQVEPASCCSPGSGGSCGDKGQISSDLYDALEVADLPSAAVLASLGCGNPTALAELRPGEVVLDLGSGGGIDVLLSAKRVGPQGFAYGLDMTDEMLELANKNAAERGVTNVKFLKGQIEAIPLPSNSVDVVISNCVINLSADKQQVLREALRVLKPGGRLAVSDVVVQGELPPDVRRSMELWAGCIAGALEEHVYRQLLASTGFDGVEVEVTRVYDAKDAATSCCSAEGVATSDALGAFEQAGGRLVSAFIRATKPTS